MLYGGAGFGCFCLWVGFVVGGGAFGLPGCGDCALFSLVCLRFGFSV